ncbi:hypothetical protein S83_027471, partial [Arachis hypogaea]
SSQSIYIMRGGAAVVPSKDLNAFRTLQRDLGLNSQCTFSQRSRLPSMVCSATPSQPPTFSKNLNGTLSSAIGHLTALKELSLSDNHLLDRIPNSIVNLKKLEILDLRGNGFSGEVPPHLSSLARLRLHDVSSNKFLKYFSNLEKLNVADNLFVGRVPVSIRSFRNLRHQLLRQVSSKARRRLPRVTMKSKTSSLLSQDTSSSLRTTERGEPEEGEAGSIGGARCQEVLRSDAGRVQEASPWVEAVSPVKNE